MNNFKNVIAVMSGKGGVGKSTATSLIAASLNKEGYKVGILDADITGPSIPKAFGLRSRKDKKLKLEKTKSGIKIMSLNLLIDNEEDPVIWRGPILSKTVMQFYNDVNWGELDYLIIDFPPGTSDITLTAMQSMKIDGVIIVSTPQDLVSLIVKKSINMVKKMDIPILGIFENMSYFICNECKTKHYIFGNKKLDDYTYIARLKIDKKISKLADAGRIEKYLDQEKDLKNKIIKNIKKELNI